ncbi:MAG: class I SAM-dependent methyltransferase [Alphaproteobacteria bacterium]
MRVGCRVDCIDMSSDYCAGAALLNRLTGLEDRVKVHQGSALDLPFPDDSFDIAKRRHEHHRQPEALRGDRPGP